MGSCSWQWFGGHHRLHLPNLLSFNVFLWAKYSWWDVRVPNLSFSQLMGSTFEFINHPHSEFPTCLRQSSSSTSLHSVEEHISSYVQTIDQSSILKSPDEIIKHWLPSLWPADLALECLCSIQVSLRMDSPDKLKNTGSQDSVSLRVAMLLHFGIEAVEYKLNFYLFCGIIVDHIFLSLCQGICISSLTFFVGKTNSMILMSIVLVK